MTRDARAPLRIVSLEDDVEDALLVERALRASGIPFVFRRVEGREEFLRALAEEEPPDVILSDHSVPSLTGLEALALARERRPGIPFIFVSGQVTERYAVELLKAGATGCVHKDNLTALGAAVRRAVLEAALRRDFDRAQAALRLFDRIVSRILAASLRPEEAIRAVLQALCRELGWPLALYWRMDSEAGASCGSATPGRNRPESSPNSWRTAAGGRSAAERSCPAASGRRKPLSGLNAFPRIRAFFALRSPSAPAWPPPSASPWESPVAFRG
jgi:CheY-like chemotaxis protein